MREIGSEFSFSKVTGNYSENRKEWIPFGSDFSLTFSGRTAIETVLRNIETSKKAMLPSYCCKSMIEPFQTLGIEVAFYDVYFKDGLQIELDISDDCDIVLWCNYFGFHTEYPQEQLNKFKERGGIIIEDITHSMLSEKQYNLSSDYLVGSIRKWGALLSGGICSKRNGKFAVKPQKMPDEVFLKVKNKAMQLKMEYLQNNDEEKKKRYLRMFAESNKWLEENYSLRMIDETSEKILSGWDIDEIRKRRIDNARALYRYLKNVDIVKPLFPEEKMDCPLFVPVIVEKEKRDDIRARLIENKIYCPVHWPKSQEGCNSNLYDMEISLVCDQRYLEKDMKRIIDVIQKC